jgi:hypothetical protein
MMKPKEEFNKQWLCHYPDSPPVSHWFKWAYPDRWFRVHSLPRSKRWPDNDKEWKILLARQNKIITDIFGLGTEVCLVSSDADWEFKTLSALHNDNGEMYLFTHIGKADLYKLDMEYYRDTYLFDKHTFKPVFAKMVWKPHLHDTLLKEIANGNAEAFFVSFSKVIIIAPYDGGIDFVLKDGMTRDFYKNKYKKWVSNREDGL